MFPGSYYTDGSGNHYRCLMVTGQKIVLLCLGTSVAKVDLDWNDAHLYQEVGNPHELKFLEGEYRKVKDIVEGLL
jgi:hypothetical protein